MKILLLGSGGREHALAWKIAQSPKVEKLYIAPGNAGTTAVGENVNIKATDFVAGCRDVVAHHEAFGKFLAAFQLRSLSRGTDHGNML